MIEGGLKTRSWEGKDGVKRYKTEVVAESLQLGPKPKGTQVQNTKPSPAKVSEGKEEIPVVNENDSPSDLEVEEDEVKLKDVPF